MDPPLSFSNFWSFLYGSQQLKSSDFLEDAFCELRQNVVRKVLRVRLSDALLELTLLQALRKTKTIVTPLLIVYLRVTWPQN